MIFLQFSRIISTAKISLLLLYLSFAFTLSAQEEHIKEWSIPARLALEAFKESYPEVVGQVLWRDDDWTIEAGGRIFYWAEGRLLPAEKRNDWGDYSPYITYDYPDLVRDPSTISAEALEIIRKKGSSERRKAVKERCLDFQEALYGPLSRTAIEGRLVRVSLFGWATHVDALVAPALRRVDKRVMSLAKEDRGLSDFLRTLGPVGGYNWREIKGTPVKSYHSWALAIDILPKRIGSLATFWDWERVYNPDWPILPLSRRWHPHSAIVEAFEAEGFVWGGKWDLWDTMHFEYRPELLWIRESQKTKDR